MRAKSRIGKEPKIRNLVVISDTHVGSRVGLWPSEFQIDGGNVVRASKYQKILLSWWEEFWGDFVPRETDGEPFAIVHNGDAIDGVPHGSVHQMSHNMEDQVRAAIELFRHPYEMAEGRWFHIRGTEAHVSKSGQHEESLAKQLGAIRDRDGQYARWQLWKKLEDEGTTKLVSCLHHIGTTGSTHYESSAVMGELAHALTEGARWGGKIPDVIVRSHRHRAIEVRVPCQRGWRTAVVTPAWQLRTPFAWKIPGARVSPPQIGGIIIRLKRGYAYTVPWIQNMRDEDPE